MHEFLSQRDWRKFYHAHGTSPPSGPRNAVAKLNKAGRSKLRTTKAVAS